MQDRKIEVSFVYSFVFDLHKTFLSLVRLIFIYLCFSTNSTKDLRQRTWYYKVVAFSAQEEDVAAGYFLKVAYEESFVTKELEDVG